MDDLNLSPVPPAAALSEQAASLASRPSEALANTASEPLANGGCSASGPAASSLGSTSSLEPTPRRGAARRDWIVIAVCVVMLMAMGIWLFRAGPQNQQDVARPEPKRVSREEFVEVGGVRRPASDLSRSEATWKKPKGPAVNANALPRQSIKDDGTNPQIASVKEAMRTKTHPERLSSLIIPAPFDAAAYRAGPEKYLNVVEPGRVWQAAQPGPGVKRLTSVSSEYEFIEQGQSVSLKVQAAPGAPVTFTSFDLGAFDNQLTSQTVKADETGLAKATFIGTGGTRGEVKILAASPLSSGQVQFLVQVDYPKKRRV